MHHDQPDHKTSNDKPIRHLHDVTRRARILRHAANVIDADLRGHPITPDDVPRLLARSIPVRDAQAIADTIRDLRAAGCMDRDAEADWLRGTAHAVITDSRRGGAR